MTAAGLTPPAFSGPAPGDDFFPQRRFVLTCREVTDFLMDYVSGDLPPDVRARFEEHLQVCPPCVVFLKTYRQTMEMEKAAYMADETFDIPEELVGAILASRSG